MYIQGKESIYDLECPPGVSYGDIYHQNEVEQAPTTSSTATSSSCWPPSARTRAMRGT